MKFSSDKGQTEKCDIFFLSRSVFSLSVRIGEEMKLLTFFLHFAARVALGRSGFVERQCFQFFNAVIRLHGAGNCVIVKHEIRPFFFLQEESKAAMMMMTDTAVMEKDSPEAMQSR